jgi:hypothetical protein
MACERRVGKINVPNETGRQVFHLPLFFGKWKTCRRGMCGRHVMNGRLRLPHRRLHAGLADGTLLAELGPAADFARLFVMFALAEFFLQATAFQKFLEPAKGRAYRLSIVHTHP